MLMRIYTYYLLWVCSCTHTQLHNKRSIGASVRQGIGSTHPAEDCLRAVFTSSTCTCAMYITYIRTGSEAHTHIHTCRPGLSSPQAHAHTPYTHEHTHAHTCRRRLSSPRSRWTLRAVPRHICIHARGTYTHICIYTYLPLRPLIYIHR